VIHNPVARRHNRVMAESLLGTLSKELADLTESGAPFVVQVSGAGRPATGIVHGPDTIVTTARAIGREDGLSVRIAAGPETTVDASLIGWDPATGIALLRTAQPIGERAPQLSDAEPRTGEIVVAVARSWSNVATSSAGIVAIVGGPLRTGRRRQIARVFRVTAPMHDGFAGGAVLDTSGRVIGVATASALRGLGVVIPVSIAWASAAQVLASGTPRRGFVGVAVQPVELPASQQIDSRARALVVVGVTPSSPADTAGLMVGDILLEFDGQRTESASDLLDLLTGSRVGKTVNARVLRAGATRDLTITIGERPRG
jgi:serine protease DegQ